MDTDLRCQAIRRTHTAVWFRMSTARRPGYRTVWDRGVPSTHLDPYPQGHCIEVTGDPVRTLVVEGWSCC